MRLKNIKIMLLTPNISMCIAVFFHY